jgi:hypothetical protein
VTWKESTPLTGWIGCISVITACTPPTVNTPPPSTRSPGLHPSANVFGFWVLNGTCWTIDRTVPNGSVAACAGTAPNATAAITARPAAAHIFTAGTRICALRIEALDGCRRTVGHIAGRTMGNRWADHGKAQGQRPPVDKPTGTAGSARGGDGRATEIVLIRQGDARYGRQFG